MKSTRWMKWVCCAVFICGLALTVEARKDEITLVLVPREAAATRIGLDLAERYTTLLITYKVVPGGGVSLHGWAGTKWVNITPADYVEGNFFKKGPDSALIIEKAGAPVPASLIPPEAWCDEVYKVTTAETRPLLHLTGQYFDFKYKDWKWFAKRYKQDIDAINPDGLNMAWYHKRLDDHIKSGKPVGSRDLQYWVAVRHQVVLEKPAGEGTGQVAEPGEAIEDPFTNAVPPAVVMGAGDAPEEHAEREDDDSAEVPAPEEEQVVLPEDAE